MRLLQLVTAPGELLDLHPHVTVVQGLDQAGRSRLVDAVNALAQGTATADGLLEAHGVLFDLDPQLLELLRIEARELAPVVHRDDLPGLGPGGAARDLAAAERALDELAARLVAQTERHTAAAAAVEAAAAAVARAREGLAEVAARTARRDELAARLAELDERERALVSALDAAAGRALAAADLAAERGERADRLDEQRAALQAEREVLAADLDEASEQAVRDAAAELQRIDAELAAPAAAPASAPELDASDAADRLADIERRLEVLDHLIASLEPAGVEPVRAAFEELLASDTGELLPSEEALRLADELVALDGDLAHVEAQPEAADLSAEQVAAMRQQLDDARTALRAAEDARHGERQVDPQDAAELERIHEALLEAVERTEGPLAGGRARRRVDELRAEEEALLARLGLLSFSEYLMGTAGARPDAGLAPAVEAARAAVDEAEAAWARVERHNEVALARAEVLERRRRRRGRARELLGTGWRGPATVVDDLRALRVPAPAPAGQCHDLQHALRQVGIDFGDEAPEAEDLLLVAQAWLEEVGAVDERAAAHQRERAALAAEADALRGSAPPLPVDGPHLAALETERASALEALAAAEARWRRHQAAAERDEAVAAELEALEAEASDLDRPGAAEQPADADPTDDLEQELAALRRARAGLATEQAAVTSPSEARPDPDIDRPAELEELEAAEAAHADALAALEVEAAELLRLETARDDAAAAVARLGPIAAAAVPDGAPPDVTELEWYLLARVASQRSASVAGALPLLLHDPFDELSDDAVDHLLGRLDRMADTVQVIVVSDHPAVAGWAEEAGEVRAAVVRPTPT